MKLTKKYIDENLFRSDGKLNNRRLDKFTAEEVYLVYYSLEIPSCKNCSQNTKFYNFTKGYQTFCSHSCSSKYQKHYLNGTNKILNMTEEEKKIKRNKTYNTYVIKYGRIPAEEKPLYEQYLIKVRNFSENQDLSKLDFIQNRGRAGIKNAYHLDHRFSIYNGYKNNIPVHIIGGIKNLKMIPWEENTSKSSSNSCLLEDIF